jgi:hypothetical protein
MAIRAIRTTLPANLVDHQGAHDLKAVGHDEADDLVEQHPERLDFLLHLFLHVAYRPAGWFQQASPSVMVAIFGAFSVPNIGS